jgi:transcriptional regulator with XRE-family HTH domain
MADTIRFPDELGPVIRARRLALGLSKKALAQRAGKVREVIYRIEGGEDVSLSSLMAVLNALGLVMRLENAGLPTMQEVAARFSLDEEDEDDADAS